MIEQYAHGFAQVYDERWNPYPTRAAAQLLTLHEALDPGAERRVLDIGCGTGIVGAAFQQAGYEVTGLDASQAMLERARARLGEGSTLIHGDAADFRVDKPFPFVVSTYDIPNHLGGMERVRSYLECVFRAVRPGGLFAFDVATRNGLRSINTIQVRETDESIVIYRGALDEQAGFGMYRISGTVRAADGRYDRFQATITNSIVPLDELLAMLKEVGWTDTYLAAPSDLTTPLDGDPDALADRLIRVYVVTRRPA